MADKDQINATVCYSIVGRGMGATYEGAVFDATLSPVDVGACIADVEAVLGAGACVICGDGNVDAGEQCDDGNLTAGDGCAPDCTTE